MSSNVEPSPVSGNPYASFRPRFGTVVAYTFAVVLLGGFVFIALTADGPIPPSAWDRAGTIGLGLVCAAILWRLGAVRALPTPHGLTVHNIVFTRRLEWAEVVSVRFGSGDPWVRLDLSDGKSLAVMGIQRSDGRRGDREAQRLAALVQAHGEAGGLRA